MIETIADVGALSPHSRLYGNKRQPWADAHATAALQTSREAAVACSHMRQLVVSFNQLQSRECGDSAPTSAIASIIITKRKGRHLRGKKRVAEA